MSTTQTNSTISTSTASVQTSTLLSSTTSKIQTTPTVSASTALVAISKQPPTAPTKSTTKTPTESEPTASVPALSTQSRTTTTNSPTTTVSTTVDIKAAKTAPSHIAINNTSMCTSHSLRDTPYSRVYAINHNKIILFIFNLFLCILFLTNLLYKLNFYQNKFYTHTMMTTLSSYDFYTSLHMHDFSSHHVLIPLMLPTTLTSLAIAYATELRIPTKPQMLDVLAPTTLDAPVLQSTTLDAPADPFYPQDPGSQASIGSPCFITFGPSNPHDPGPLAVTAGRIVALIYIIAPIIMTTIQFAKYDYLRVCPRSPQCMNVVSFL
jgi:hypothetical protein